MTYRNFLRKCFLNAVVVLLPGILIVNANSISGKINLDTSWSPNVYLSIISDFDQLNSMSNQMIIESSKMDKVGQFSFTTEYLPAENYMYRIHFSKKDDPPASLIIGGKDENYMYLIANKESNIFITNCETETIFGNVMIENSPQSQLINEINKMVRFIDTVNFNSSALKRELVENALDEKLRQFADTCSFPLVALYAIYKSNFEVNSTENPNYYSRFLEKWKNEKSAYFKEFRKNIPNKNQSKSSPFLFGITGLIFGIFLTLVVVKFKRNNTNPLHELTIQERKIYALLQNEKTNKEISEEMSISLSTVKSHVNNIFSKLNIKSRREIASF